MKILNNIQVSVELAELTAAASDALASILMNTNRLEKHGTYTWLKEDRSEHLLKGSRHAITQYIIDYKMQNPSDENHLDLAITRLIMAKAIELRGKNEET